MQQTRYVDRDTGDYPKDALFAENACVNGQNDHVLNQMSVDKIVIPCHDTVVSANISTQRCQELIQSLPNDLGKTGNLMKSLTLAIGMIYVMTVNVNVEDGLINGATGVVKFIDYRMQGTKRPSLLFNYKKLLIMSHLCSYLGLHINTWMMLSLLFLRFFFLSQNG